MTRHVLMAALAACASGVAGFSLDGIERWSGSGASRAALVIDWHDGTRPHALAWGVHFDGAITALDLWNTVTANDTGLTGTFDNGTVVSVAYSRPTRAGDILPGTGSHVLARKTAYTWDHAASDGIWTLWRGNGTAFTATNLTRITVGLSATAIADGDWFALSFSSDADAPRPPGFPAAALHYPFATKVETYAAGTGSYRDWLSGELFNKPNTALGRPTVDTTGDDWYIPEDEQVPVVAVYPAFRSYEMVMLGNGGYLELSFDHRVYDNPDNPYGIDLIVFGNSFQIIGGGNGWYNDDPNLTLNGGSAFVEKGKVSVSQDGVTWFSYPSGDEDKGADDFAPTLGRVYDTNRVEQAVGEWNAWWGGATDPTIPVDPALAPSNWVRMSVAEISERYRGSAGGTGFDIGEFELERDPDTGHKWIQYVRVDKSGSVFPEVDAVADVSPALPYDLWRNVHFTWMNAPTNEVDRADPDDDGIANLMEYGLGRDPTNAVAEASYTVEMRPPDAPDVFRFHYTVATNAPDVAVEIVRTADLLAPEWNTDGVLTAATAKAPTNGAQATVSEVPVTGNRGFMRLRVRHDE